MSIINVIFNTMTNVITSFFGALGSAFDGVGSLFIKTVGTGAEATTEPTLLAVVCLISAGCGLVYWVFRMIKGYISARR